MSSRIFQGVIIQMKDATTRPLGVIDSEGTVVASSELGLIGSHIGVFPTDASEMSDRVIKSFGKTFRMLGTSGSQFDYAVFVEGEDDYARTICVMAYIALSEAKLFYEENHDKNAFIKNILSSNILPGDIYVRAKELHFTPDASRIVYLVRMSGKMDSTAMEVLQELYPDRQKDFVVSVNETDIAVILENDNPGDSAAVASEAKRMEEQLHQAIPSSVVIGIGTPAHHIRELPDRYKEAQVAIDIGKVFDSDKTVINYENLGIGRLIYQLPTTLCEMFLMEVFKKNPIETLDNETLYTINKFFENNLNVSEASRKLFVHRNTLVYRLEKIKKLTGLDLREFDHAIVFKVALMVKQYLNSQEKHF